MNSNALRGRRLEAVFDMQMFWCATKSLAKKFWFRQGKVRRCFIGPYEGLSFEICPQLLNSRMIVFYRAYEPEVTSLLNRLLQPGMVVLDVGAHIGIHALYIAKLLKADGLVYAFEPCPDNFLQLQKNVIHNSRVIAKVIPIRKAVGSQNGFSGLTFGATDGTHHLTTTNEVAALEVEITTLDSFWSETRQRPNLILADVEGEEISLLRGAERMIRECRPKLILEHHGTYRHRQIRTWLTKMGYKVEPAGRRHVYAE